MIKQGTGAAAALLVFAVLAACGPDSRAAVQPAPAETGKSIAESPAAAVPAADDENTPGSKTTQGQEDGPLPGKSAAAPVLLEGPGKPSPAAAQGGSPKTVRTVTQSTYDPDRLSPDRTPRSWYYMKKKTGEVPGFPNDIKKFKPEDKVLWVGTGKKVYLTLDNGGPMGDTGKLLKTLRDNKVKANFFIAGYNLKKYPDFVRELVKDGHLVANHTMTHTDFNELTDGQIRKEITDYEVLYKQITGREIGKYFRFPYGRYNLHDLDLVSQMGYTSVFWSTAMRDWEPRKNGPDDAYNDIMNNLHDGNIILMHQGSEDNINALDRIIKAIRNQGYEFARLDDIQPPGGPAGSR